MQTLFVHNSKTDIRTACEVKHAPMHWHNAGVWQTTTGYGKRIATANMLKFNGKWRRIYCCIYSNIGTCYIGKLNGACGENLIVRDY